MFDFLFGKTKDQIDNEYSKAIKDTKQTKAESAYQHYYNKALYDANKDYFDSIGVKDPSASYWNDNGQKTNALSDTMNQYGKYLNDLSKEREDVARQNKYNIYGNGLIGGLLNPFHQAGTAVQDLITSGSSEWDKGNRDVLSDLGAIGESALTVAPVVGGMMGAGNVAKAGAKTLGNTMLKGAGYGAGYGALGALTEMGGKNFDLGNLAARTAIGGAVGAGMSGLGYGIGKVGDKFARRAQTTRDLSNAYQQYLNQQKAGAVTDASKLLGDGAGGTSVVNVQQSPATEWLMNRGDLAKTKLGQTIQGIKDTLSYNKMMGNSVGDKVKNAASKVSNSKVGNKVSSLLKTKKGKVAAGLGGGLLLSQLMRGGNSNSGELTDEEMQELYNYIYGGGQ